jgi:carboxymethylenebutenolidase
MPMNGQMVKLKIGKGYFVEAGETGVLVLHGWWGLHNFFKGFSDSLSKEGFSVLALDLYDGKIATDIESAKQLRGSLDRQISHETIKSAIAYLREKNENQIGVIGFSMGANRALWTMDNCYKDVGATVLYYGTSGGRFRKAKSPVLGHFAEDDPYERPEKVSALQSHLQAEKIPTKFYTYAGTKHWFAEDYRPEYDPKSAQLAWGRTVEFLQLSLRGGR